jgi:hypothetical protein
MISEWHDFFVVTGGAAAALTGLIFVGVSLNLSKILSFKQLPNRALLSLILLLSVLVVSLLFLIPEESFRVRATELTGFGIILWAIITRLDMINYANTESPYRKQYRLHMLIDQLATLAYPLTGIALGIWGEKGIYVVVPGIIFSFFKAVFDAWVLLIEINR